MGKRSHRNINKIPSIKKKLVQQLARTDKKMKRAKIQKLRHNASKIKGGELRVPQLQKLQQKLQAQVLRKKNGTERVAKLRSKNQQGLHLQKLQASNGMEMEEEEMAQESLQRGNLKNVKNTTQSLDEILEQSDVLLEVLDARDPMGCRCRALERKFIEKHPDRKIILVLNKIDLVPQDALLSWKKVLSAEFPTVLFKANLQRQTKNLGSTELYQKSFSQRTELAKDLISSAKAVGVPQLLQLLKNYSKVGGLKTRITVGIVGYPNVGKSSLINSMTLKRSVGVSSKPGHTKHIQRIELDSQVQLLDCPGVFFSGESETQLLLKNAIKPEEVQDLLAAVDAIVARAQKSCILELYEITDFEDSKQLLVLLAQRWGKLKKKGVLDLEETARMLVRDWNSGRLRYFVSPPLELTHFENTVVANNYLSS